MTYNGLLIKEPQLRWPIVLTAALVTAAIALIVAMLYYMAMTGPVVGSYEVPQLKTALRAGHPEFEQFRHQIAIEGLSRTERVHALNDFAVEMAGTIKNNTGRTLNWLEIRGAILDRNEKALRERTVVVIPVRQTVLEPNEAINVRILLQSINRDSDRAQLRWEITGLSFSQS